MNKRIYEMPKMHIVSFESSDNTNYSVSSVQSGFKKSSYSILTESKNKINF